MPTYIYETIPATPGQKVRRFEVKQSMKDAPLRLDPESGQPVQRVISGGFAPMLAGAGADASCVSGACSLPPPPSHGCGPACGCVGN
ncbi:MAG: zinc ribbon domain-containing protein [Verrucomicrobia bacterium]|nr:zinc ribbon domain-containing protein [Verrucomicrobiota bacterium]